MDASPPTEEDGYPQVRSAEHTPSARQATVVLPLRRGHRSGSERHGRVDTPKRVVIVDAENPLQEIHGEFFWREDHDRIVADEREDALRLGYADGYAAARSELATRLLVPHRRRLRLGRLLLIALVLLVATWYVVALLGNLVHA